MKLIKELTEDVEYLKEENESGGKQYYVKGTIMQGDIKNRNGRVYPSNVLMKEVTRYNEEFVSKKRAFGELGHPQGPTVNPDRVSHMFSESLRQEGSNIVGKAKVMDTPMGKIVKNFIDEGAQLGISSRGMGSIKENKSGIMEVQSDFYLATAGDIVTDPSGPNCFIQGIMEGVEFFFDEKNNLWTQMQADKVTQVEEEIKETGGISRELLEHKTLRLFQKLVKEIG